MWLHYRSGAYDALGQVAGEVVLERGAHAGDEVLAELREVNRLLVEDVTPEEREQFREWLKTAAQRAATAAKEGGFMGFRAELVSEGERQMLDKLAEVLGSGDD